MSSKISLVGDFQQGTYPLNDGSKGSALYSISIELSSEPKPEWIKAFLKTWDNPPSFTTRHRPGIADVVDDEIWLDGTTLEEAEKYHRKTIDKCIEKANKTIK